MNQIIPGSDQNAHIVTWAFENEMDIMLGDTNTTNSVIYGLYEGGGFDFLPGVAGWYRKEQERSENEHFNPHPDLYSVNYSAMMKACEIDAQTLALTVQLLQACEFAGPNNNYIYGAAFAEEALGARLREVAKANGIHFNNWD